MEHAAGQRLGQRLVASILCGSTGPDEASAAPGEPTSCLGIEASDISPPGSSEEAPGGMPDLLAFVDSLGQDNRGVVVSSLAQLHEGSHAACDAAFE